MLDIFSDARELEEFTEVLEFTCNKQLFQTVSVAEIYAQNFVSKFYANVEASGMPHNYFEIFILLVPLVNKICDSILNR